MALRREEPDFLLEGRLASNDAKETNFFPKLALQLPANKEEWKKKYRKARKPAGAMAKGALTASLIANILSGGRAKAGYLAYSAPAAIGAGAGLADYLASKKKKIPTPPSATKVAMAGSDTFTPGRALTQGRNTSSFQDKVIHKGGELRPATIGRNFRLPTE